MLKRFSVRNYKNFKGTFEFDFSKVGGYKFNEDCIIKDNNVIGKAVIYGRNATGKSNLGRAVWDIYYVIELKFGLSDYIKNADSDEDKVFFEYEFSFGGKTVLYKYVKNEINMIVGEDFYIDGKKVFSADIENYEINVYDTDIFDNSAAVEKYQSFIEDRNKNAEDYDDFDETNCSFLRFYLNCTNNENDNILNELETYVRGMRLLNIRQQADEISTNSLSIRSNKAFLDYLEKEERLQEFESFLNSMGIPCKLFLKVVGKGMNELYFEHGKTNIPFFTNASSGTISIVNFYKRFLVFLKNMTFMYLDEFDAFYHYELAEKLVRFIKKNYPETQVIFTTHNTNLMTNQLMRPDCLLILSNEGRITPLCDATQRELREGHNLEKLYISGEFMDYE